MNKNNLKSYWVQLNTQREYEDALNKLLEEAANPGKTMNLEEAVTLGNWSLSNEVNEKAGRRVKKQILSFLHAKGLLDQVEELRPFETLPLFYMKCTEDVAETLKSFHAPGFAGIEETGENDSPAQVYIP